MSKNLITINEIVKKYKVPYSTINHYTILGLLTVVSKKRNTRLYDEEAVRKSLKQILKLKNQGYPLNLIKNHFIKKP